MHTDLIYLSAGCNTSPHCLTWGDNGVLLYASDANIIVCDPHITDRIKEGIAPGFQARHSLRNHSEPVNCVRWIKNCVTGLENEFISVSSDKTCVIWSMTAENAGGNDVSLENRRFSVVQFMEAKAALQVGKATYIPGDTLKCLLAVADIDGVVNLWYRQDKVGFEIVKTIDFGRTLILDLDWVFCPVQQVNALLACGGDDGKIHLSTLCINDNEITFANLTALSGHEDWIRCVEFSGVDQLGVIHLLSAGQDSTIRLWTINETVPEKKDDDDLWAKVNKKVMRLPGSSANYEVTYDTLIFGHEGWIYGAHWSPARPNGKDASQPLRIVSASMDKSIIVWQSQQDTGGVWTDIARMGEVGGNNLGFYGCQFDPTGNCLISHSYSGSLHMWRYDESADAWYPGVVCGGHYSSVNDIVWDSRGLYLLSTSQDQTTRLHAPWVHTDGERFQEEWHEISRPQVHGYDLVCLASTGFFSFASGADEKIIRLFEAPRSFLENFSDISKVNVDKELPNAAEGAAVPALGLSNKALSPAEEGQGDQRHPTDRYAEFSYVPVRSSCPPPEEDLIQNTLWPETNKLYGHGYEISTLACNHAATLLASASRANHPEHAEIFLWSKQPHNAAVSTSWVLSGRLCAHALTVTQMCFSHNDDFLLSVSRDRTWSLFKRQNDGVPYQLCLRPDKSQQQSRIIWTCAWTPDDKYFVTGSRDKTIFVYHVSNKDPDHPKVDLVHRLTMSEAVTAIDLELLFGDAERYLMVVGSDNGSLQMFTFNRAGTEEPSHVSSLSHSHHKTLNRIAFQPMPEVSNCTFMKFATCGMDRAVKIFKLRKTL
ncbi:elongator complex protein 2-like [Paramacrobiotus metropolitanus]|uniref:elongator complex protein 2-like n=1 Tax=Paramacrobiotus metropolitanus TaxID=2943436 RepID=UPI00244612E8|nr:elongator complex protein 2-like [Paramacrobiotus metropolitanus]